jgi:predicted nucleic acid-binding protein
MAVDTSVVVPALALWHEDHAKAFAFLDHEPGVVLIGHVALETYSVLTRMPPPKRARPDHVAQALRETFPGPVVALSGTAYLDLIDRAVSGAVQGGGVYDALVAATAKDEGLKLISLDQRAAATYAKVGVAYEIL